MDTMERLLKKKSVVGFRRLLYLVTPNETSFETVNEVPDYVTEAIPFFLILVILEVPLLIWQKRKLPRFNDGFSSIANGILSQLHSLLFRSTELAAYIWMYKRFNIVNLPWNDPWTWLLGFVGVDFCYYWVHRCGHEVNIMWAGHQVHHSSEDYNLTTALRQSAFHKYTLWVNIIWAAHQTHHSSEDYNLTTALRQSCILKYLSWMFYLPLALVMPPSVFLVHTQFNLLYQFWIHTEVIRTLGPLEWIFNTPSHHRVHHGRNRYCIDKNYGGTLIIFDRIFGTFEAEKDEVVYGLVHNIDSWNPLYSQYCHLKYMAQTFLEVKGFSNKMSVIWKGPGWLPGKPRLGLPEDIPHVEAPVEKYDKHLPLWTNLYIWTHFLILLVGFVLIADHKQSLSAVFTVGCIVYIIYSLSCFGAIFDHRETAPLMEFIRCLVFVVSMYILNSETITVGLSIAYSVYIVHVASLSLWTYICARHYTSSIKVKPH